MPKKKKVDDQEIVVTELYKIFKKTEKMDIPNDYVAYMTFMMSGTYLLEWGLSKKKLNELVKEIKEKASKP